MMEQLMNDVRYALRGLVRQPGFTIAAVLTLALATGGAAAMASLVNALLFRPLPVDRPAELVAISQRSAGGETERYFSLPDVEALREADGAFAGLTSFALQGFSAGTGEAAANVLGAFVTQDYFAVLGLRPARGRFFAADDERPGAAPTVVLSHDYWQRHLGGDDSTVGRTLHLNGQAVAIIGVAPAGFQGTMSVVGTEFWVPAAARAVLLPSEASVRMGRWLQVIGRLGPGVEAARAEASLASVAPQLGPAQAGRGRGAWAVTVEPLRGTMGEGRTGLAAVGALLLGAALLVLAIASINIAGMLLARAATRRSDVAIRLALGAERGRVLRLLLTESVLLWLLGGLAGVVLSVWLVRAMPALMPVQTDVPVRLGLDMSLDIRVMVFTLAVSLATGLAFGLSPALQALRVDLVSGLRDRAGSGRRQARTRSVLLVAQVASSVLLLAITGLFLRAAQHAYDVDPGFDPDGVVVGTVDLTTNGFSRTRGEEFYAELLTRLRARPGVRAATLASSVPLGSSHATIGVTLPPGVGNGLAGGEQPVRYSAVATDYFRTLRIPLLRGRDFTAADRARGEAVVVVSQAMARRVWGASDPVGRSLRIGTGTARVVGVAADVEHEGIGRRPGPYLYLPHAQHYTGQMHVLVRAPGASARIVGEEVRTLEPGLPLTSAMALRTLIVSLMPQQMVATLLGGLGAFGLLLVAVGIYGVTAYGAAQRAREIAVRVALGAHPRDVVRLVVGGGLRLVGIGVACGLAAALAIGTALEQALAGRSALDPVPLAAVAALLLAVSAFASWLPARRASRLHPMNMLRSE